MSGLLLVGTWPKLAPGQGPPGTNLIVDVRVSSVTLAGDTARVEYLLSNRATSVEKLVFFTVNAPAPPVSVTIPEPNAAWDAFTTHRNRPMASWIALKTIAQGAASPPLSFRAIGLPAVVTAWYRGNSLPTLGEGDPDAPEPDPTIPTLDEDPLLTLSVPVHTVGIDPLPPGATPGSLTTRLEGLTAQACALGWITQASLCNTLRGHLTAQPSRLAAFQNDLAAGHTPGGPVTDNAYWLLKVNADYILSLPRLPLPR